ncbi:hypothetical protein ACP70R_004274 [Stipagrostis hirtigluma subsp. patula]
MSRYLKQYEKEHMKMAMLKQEETFKQQVQELHRLYRVQKLLMTDAANAMPIATGRCKLEDERRSTDKEAGSSRSWDAYSPEQKKSPLVLEERELELTLAIGSVVGASDEKAAKKEASSSVDSRTSITSSSTESGSPDCPAARIGRHLEQQGLQQPPWLHQCLNLAR